MNGFIKLIRGSGLGLIIPEVEMEMEMEAFFCKAQAILPSHFQEKGKGLRPNGYQSQQKKGHHHNLEGFSLLRN